MKSIKKSNIFQDLAPSEYSIINTLFDIEDFKELLNKNLKLFKIYREGQEKYPQFEQLHQDVYSALYKYNPEITPADKLAYRFHLNKKIMELMLELPKYKELRNLTRLDRIQTALGCEIIGESVQELVDEILKDFENVVNDIQQLAQEMSQEEQGTSDTEEGQAISENKLTLEEAKEKLKALEEKLNEVVEKVDTRKLNLILEAAVDNTVETSNLISNWGLEKSDSYQKSGYQEKLELLNKIRGSKKLKEISNLAGRYRRLALDTARQKMKIGFNEVYDIIPGDNINRLLPSEAALLTSDITKLLFYKKFLEKSLLIYKYDGSQKKNKGPLVCCVDSSYSMHGLPELWSKSLVLGLLELANAQKRSVFIIHFSANTANNMHVNYFPKSKNIDIDTVIDLCEHFEGGGTLFEPPLNLAREKINSDGEEFSKADIIFITDGNAAMSNKFVTEYNKWKKERSIKVYSVLINVSANTAVSLKEISDKIDKLSNIISEQDNLAKMLFQAI